MSVPPLFWSGRPDPPLYKYTKSEILLGLPTFQTKVTALDIDYRRRQTPATVTSLATLPYV